MTIEDVNAKSNAGLTTGIIGTALSGLLTLGGLGMAHSGVMGNGYFGNGYAGNGNGFVTKDELRMSQELAQKDSTIALLQSEQNTEVKIADVYERLITRINADARAQADWNAQQMVNNAQVSAAVAANATSIAALQNSCAAITKLVVPNSAICPGWGNVTVTPEVTTTTTGA